MPLTYTNRRHEPHYFRAVQTAKGGTRYYIVKSLEYPDLIDEVPEGFEIYEQPYEACVVLRKKVLVPHMGRESYFEVLVSEGFEE